MTVNSITVVLLSESQNCNSNSRQHQCTLQAMVKLPHLNLLADCWEVCSLASADSVKEIYRSMINSTYHSRLFTFLECCYGISEPESFLRLFHMSDCSQSEGSVEDGYRCHRASNTMLQLTSPVKITWRKASWLTKQSRKSMTKMPI